MKKTIIGLLTVLFLFVLTVAFAGCDGNLDFHKHDYIEIDKKSATCTQDGGSYLECLTCGKQSNKEIIPALGHSYGDWQEYKKGNCTDAGEIRRYCEREYCDHYESCTITIEHIYDKQVIAPTKTTEGYTIYTCLTCGKTYKTNYVPALTGVTYEVNPDGKTCTITGRTKDKDNKIVIPASIANYKVTSIDKFAFRGCYDLVAIQIPSGVISIGVGAFEYCTKLTSIVIPDTVETIDKYAFYNCCKLTNVTIGKAVRIIDECAFSRCYNIKQIKIPDSVTYIGGRTFWACKNLQEITIPNGVNYIGSWAFRACENLKKIYCKANRQPNDWKTTWNMLRINPKSKCPVVWGYKGE